MARKGKQKMLTAVPRKFDPNFIDHLDARFKLAAVVKGRRDALEAHRGGDIGYVERSLITRLVWLELMTESYEMKFANGEPVDVGALTQLNNTLKGLYKELGIRPTARPVRSLRELMNGGVSPIKAAP
jgi:hypothetical protein